MTYVFQRAEEAFRPRQTQLSDDIKAEASNWNIAATITTIAAVAGAVFSLLSGGFIAGLISFVACTLLAVAANDVRNITDKVRKGNILQTARILASNNPREDIYADAAKEGTVIVTPDLVRWTFSPWHNA